MEFVAAPRQRAAFTYFLKWRRSTETPLHHFALVAGAFGVTVLAAMKTLSAKPKISGLTLIELLVIVAVIAILFAMLLPRSGPRSRAYVAICMNNQKQIALGLLMFKDDHGGEYPGQDSATNGGSSEFISSGQAFPFFRVLSNYLGKQTWVFVCPTDKARQAATDYAQLFDTNISYFLNLDAITNSTSILGGERHLEINDKAVNPGLFVYSTNAVLNWSRELHSKVQNGPIGGLSFADGHVQFTRITDLNSFFRNQPLATNHIIVP